ncbi:MAG: hypothetical protein ACXIVF_06650 [Rhizobiaceae bacterium]
MNAAAVLLMIVGCNGGLEECRELPAPAPFYASIEDCEADDAFAKARHSDSFDHIFSACAPFDDGLIGGDAEIVWDVTPEDGLIVAVEPMSGEDVYVLARSAEPSVQQH